MNGNLTALQRFFLAFVAFFWVLFDRRFAEGVRQLRAGTRELPLTGPSPTPEVGVTPGTPAAPTTAPVPSEVGLRPPSPVVAKEATTATRPASPVPIAAAQPAAELVALTILGTLQRDGRLVDFLSEDLDGFSDSEIGAAARTVHEGCRKTLASYVALEPIYRDPEGATVAVAQGFDPAAIRITGNVVGSPPFKGTLRHHGWRATRATFPPIATGHDPHLIAPAEVELT
jgi:hypothetical protein